MINQQEIHYAYLSLFVDTVVILAWIIYKYGLAELIPIGNLIIVTTIIRLCIRAYIEHDSYTY